MDAQTGTINIVGHIPNPNLTLRPGMFVRVRHGEDFGKRHAGSPARHPLRPERRSSFIWMTKRSPHAGGEPRPRR
ncbi:MAG: hypothetical protein ACLT8E_01220 [Akkermansia sp.]